MEMGATREELMDRCDKFSKHYTSMMDRIDIFIEEEHRKNKSFELLFLTSMAFARGFLEKEHTFSFCMVYDHIMKKICDLCGEGYEL